jgi:predicted dehydrogenase
MPQRFAVIGLDHRHVYELTQHLIDVGMDCAGYWPVTTNAIVLAGFRKRFPNLPAIAERERMLDDPSIQVIVTAAIPSERAGIAIAAMRRGKDVMSDKPGITNAAQLADVQRTVAETGRIFSICFGERFMSPTSAMARDLLRQGAIGRLVQTATLSPHRLNRALRPDWFWSPATNGSILVDLASHQVDQFLSITDRLDAEIVHAAIRSVAPERTPVPVFQDFGELILRNDVATAYIRVDWFTPDGLADWGDGRAFIVGTEGSIEVRNNLDLAGRPGSHHLFLITREETKYISCDGRPVNTFRNFANDVRDRTETAMSQAHCFAVCRIALEAEAKAHMTSSSPDLIR